MAQTDLGTTIALIADPQCGLDPDRRKRIDEALAQALADARAEAWREMATFARAGDPRLPNKYQLAWQIMANVCDLKAKQIAQQAHDAEEQR